MRRLNQTEIESLCDWIQGELEGSQLQEVSAQDNEICLAFYAGQKGLRYLHISLNGILPFLYLWDSPPFSKSKVKKPLSLFVTSHGRGHRFAKIQVQKDLGRVVNLFFRGTPGEELLLTFVAITHKVNFLASAGGKKISWNKPEELTPGAPYEEPEARSLFQLRQEWLEQNQLNKKTQSSSRTNLGPNWQRDLQKKTTALESLRKSLEAEPGREWFALGELLKTKEVEQIPRIMDVFIDRRRSRSWNMENAFAQGKLAQRKQIGAKKRLEQLQSQIAELEWKIKNAETTTPIVPDEKPEMSEKKVANLPEGIRLRKLDLGEGAVAYVGKSAADNLALLRWARPWYLWVHLRDYPSAHGILVAEKNTNIPDRLIMEVGKWLGQSLKEKKSWAAGTRIEIIYCECRFVSPIRGDKKGRVNYRNEKHLSCRV